MDRLRSRAREERRTCCLRSRPSWTWPTCVVDDEPSERSTLWRCSFASAVTRDQRRRRRHSDEALAAEVFGNLVVTDLRKAGRGRLRRLQRLGGRRHGRPRCSSSPPSRSAKSAKESDRLGAIDYFEKGQEHGRALSTGATQGLAAARFDARRETCAAQPPRRVRLARVCGDRAVAAHARACWTSWNEWPPRTPRC